MRIPTPETTWPASWKEAFAYDSEELGTAKPTPYGFLYNLRRNTILGVIKGLFSQPVRILDVAAAQGNFSIALSEMGHAVTWNDIRSELSDYVKLKAENSKIEFMPGNILQQDGKAEFDAVAAFEVIEHTAHPDQFLKHLTSFIKPGGYLILSTPNGAYCRNNLPCFSDTANKEQFETKQFKPNADGHIFLLWPSELEALAKQCNLNPVMLKTFGTPLSCGHCGIHYLHKFIPHCVLNIVEKATHIFPPFIRNFLSYGLVAVFKKEEYHVA